MSTLLLRLAGPMQSWGMKGRFTRRTTELQPTKSGIVGMLAAAMGRRRTDPIEDLAGLRMGVRVEQPGRLLRDFQTASRTGVTAPLSYRYYLSDALFLAAVEGPGEVLSGIESALFAPKFPLYLGRRAFPPTGKLSLGIHTQTMPEVLETAPWKASKSVMQSNSSPEVALRVVRDVEPDEDSTDVFEDVPLTFDPNRRLFGSRPVIEYWVRRPNTELPAPTSGHGRYEPSGRSNFHDPIGYLGGPNVPQQM